MGLPKQVQAALDAADLALAEANGEPPTSQDQAEPVQDVADPFASQSNPEPQVSVEETPPAPQPKDDVWQARYLSLKGIFEKEVPQLQHQVKVLQSDLSTAVERLNRASEQKEQTPEQPQVADPRDVENFGADLVDMVSRVASQAIGRASQVLDAKIAQFESQIAQLSDAMKGTTQQVAVTAEQSFFDRVTKLVPTWEQTNADPSFLAWLAEVDPVYGMNRQAALDRARSELNAEQAAAVFNAYLGPKKAAPKGPDPLDKHVSPRSASTAAPAPITDKPVITQAQVTAFYDAERRGAYRGNEAEFLRLEGIINAALAEGRII